MSRKTRPYLPGVAFHITSRTQGHVDWFASPVRTLVVEIVAETFRELAAARLLAFAVMSNHLHLIVQHGAHPLGRTMQPLLRRIARLVQRRHSVEGHVFERRFHSKPCLTPEYLRNAIVYAHLNPVRAGFCSDARDYPWSSHRDYSGGGSGWGHTLAGVLCVGDALALFAAAKAHQGIALRRDYQRYVEWRLAMDEYDRAVDAGQSVAPPEQPSTTCGDIHWSRRFAPAEGSLSVVPPHESLGHGPEDPPSTMDLTRIALDAVSECGVDVDLDRVRGPFGGSTVTRVRRRVIARLSDAGFTGRRIADYLRISESAVSKALAARRRDARSSAPLH